MPYAVFIRLLGDFSVTDLRGDAVSLSGAPLQALVAYLSLRMESGGTVAEAGELLFADRGAASQVAELLGELSRALRHVPGEPLRVTGACIGFDPQTVRVDAAEFDALAQRPGVQSTRQAAEHYSGDLLRSYTSGIAAFDHFLEGERLRFWQSAVRVFGRMLAAQIRAGWWEQAVETAGRLLALDPSQEVVHRTLMRLQLEQGHPDAALRRYQECAAVLRHQFGAEPSLETERVHDDVMALLGRVPSPREIFQSPGDGPVLILLLEDDLVSSALVEGFLTEAGYEVLPVTDGADALIEISRREFDLLILDINVPTLDGLRLFEIMIQKGIETPAIFTTGVAGPEAEARSLEMGAADFLRKPLRKESLLRRVRQILQRSRRGVITSRRPGQ